ncbi:hypothetical protein NDU88_002300 [Pleurodeles waltl]|uniref:Uncharacterized protein n=1 Tax=Pleurodeles waltl TaxID=8319 RepID=A0AAV7VEI2_PLEWA|nr:hypothetical protein NDU88_002300 [Pleurodeles waltl]
MMQPSKGTARKSLSQIDGESVFNMYLVHPGYGCATPHLLMETVPSLGATTITRRHRLPVGAVQLFWEAGHGNELDAVHTKKRCEETKASVSVRALSTALYAFIVIAYAVGSAVYTQLFLDQ